MAGRRGPRKWRRCASWGAKKTPPPDCTTWLGRSSIRPNSTPITNRECEAPAEPRLGAFVRDKSLALPNIWRSIMSACHSPSRRDFMRLSLAGGLYWAASRAAIGAAADSAGSNSAQAKASVLVFLEGGPSHIDMFDPKPGQETNGPFKAIDTKIAGVQFSEHFGKLAAVADKLEGIPSLSSPEGHHDRASTLLHTGYQPTPALAYPAVGAV